MRINSVDTGPTSLTPERPRGQRARLAPSGVAERSARAVRIRAGDSPLATLAGVGGRGPALVGDPPRHAGGRQEAWANRSALRRTRVSTNAGPGLTLDGRLARRQKHGAGPAGAQGNPEDTPGEATWGATLAVMSGTPRSSPFAARPRRRPSRRPCCERNSQTPFRLGTQTNRLLRAAFARGAPVAHQPADRLKARSQPIGSLIDRGSSDTVGNVSRTFSKRSRPAFPDAAFLGISQSRSRRAASASAPARRPRSWWRPRLQPSGAR